MKNILLAGATGYLGRYLLKELLEQGYPTRVVVRSPEKIPVDIRRHPNLEVVTAEVTRPEDLVDLCQGIDTVFSTVGITRQKDGLSYIDVDYQANVNLLREAKKAGVRKFVYVSVLNGDNMRQIAICAAKERFVDELKASGLAYCVVRPSGFFSDMEEFFQMATKGRAYLFGDGSLKLNPIHGADLAVECVKQIEDQQAELNIGGPDVLTHDDIATLAFQALGKPAKITHIPDGIRRVALKLAGWFMSKQAFGPVEFFLTAMGIGMVAPAYGSHHLGDFFGELGEPKH